MKVELGDPVLGWMRMGLSHEGRDFSVDASFTPYDWVTDLTDAIAKFAQGVDEVTVTLNTEPGEHELVFHVTGDRVTGDHVPGDHVTGDRGQGDRALLIVTSYPDRERIIGSAVQAFAIHQERTEICLAFWRALRQLESRITTTGFAQAWGHPFPAGKLAELTRHLTQIGGEAL